MIFDAVDSKLWQNHAPRISNIHRILEYTNGAKPVISKLQSDYRKYGTLILAVTDPYPHPQHMKVVKHMLYVWSGRGTHST